MGELADIAKKRTPYLTLEPNESVSAEYKGFKMVPSSFDPEKENFRFMLRIGDEVKFLDSGSNKLAFIFDTLVEGDMVKITRIQTGMKEGKPRYGYDVVKETA